MKKRIITLCVGAGLLVATLILIISLTMCEHNSNGEPEITDDKDKIAGVSNNIFASSGNSSGEYDPDALHGEKKVYGTLNSREMLEWNGVIGFDYERNWDQTIYYLFDDPDKGYILCFDPLCDHGGDYCPAFDNDAFEEIDGYSYAFPNHIALDKYDNVNSPVIYRAYKQAEVYNPSPGVSAEREVCYRITRYDVSSGKRITLLDSIDGTITSLNTYGDYIYYTEVATDQTVVLKCLPKVGGEPITLATDSVQSISVIEINDDKVYYTINERYLYNCTADLKDPQLLIDIAELKGSNETPALLQRVQGGYLYYFGNYESVIISKPDGTVHLSDQYKWDCFRLPIDDFGADPEIVAEDICGGYMMSAFTDNYFYYEPAVFTYSNYAGSLMGMSASGGDLCAVNLETLEQKTVVDDCGLNIYIDRIYGDQVLFFGTPATQKGANIWQQGNIWFRAYPDGTEYHAWISRTSGGDLQNYG